MARINRRKFLQYSGAGMAGILAAHRAPVFAQANTVHILRWNDFVPAADKVLREVYAPEVQKALGIRLNVETRGDRKLMEAKTDEVLSVLE